MSYGQARMRVASKVWRKNILDTKTGFTWLHGFNCHGSLVWSHGIQLIKRLDGTIGNSSHLSIIHFTFPPSKVNRSPYWSISIGICSNSEIHEWSLQIKPYILFGFYFLGGGGYTTVRFIKTDAKYLSVRIQLPHRFLKEKLVEYWGPLEPLCNDQKQMASCYCLSYLSSGNFAWSML